MTVHLVGAGRWKHPDHSERTARLLGQADVVVYDRLVGDDVLSMAAPWAELIDVGKQPGAPVNAQGVIHDLLVDRGRRFGCVVRLKGGDPFVFGRGGEEAIALAAAGVSVEEVPGITSAIAAPAAAGIPITMRGVASGVSVVTAHQDADGSRQLDWDALACSGTTLVILMGASRAPIIADRLIAAGMPSQTPAAVIQSATNDDQNVRRCQLANLGSLDIVNPATIVVGDVAALDVFMNPADLIHAAGLNEAAARAVPNRGVFR